jgi:hypothetical protein
LRRQAVILAGQISKFVNALHNGQFVGSNFSFTLNGASGPVRLFTGIEGIRLLDDGDIATLNDWADEQSQPDSGFGDYKFTHSVVGSYFGGQANSQAGGTGEPAPSAPHVDSAPPVIANTVFDGEPYKFTHSVLGSYFNQPAGETPPQGGATTMMIEGPIEPPVLTAPVPEPATWAMMIGGFALAGGLLRQRRSAIRLA